MKQTGVELIAIERKRQIEELGYTYKMILCMLMKNWQEQEQLTQCQK